MKGEANLIDALIFSLLEERGLRLIELYETRVRDVDLEKGINNIETARAFCYVPFGEDYFSWVRN